MSEQVDTGRRRMLGIYAWIGGSVLLLGGFIVMTFLRSGGAIDPNTPKDRTGSSRENHLAAVRTALGRESDMVTCRTVIGQLNEHQQGKQAGTALTTDKVKQLQNELGLDSTDVDELTSVIYTSLDAFHLETCFLLRDAARSLELAPPGGRGGKPVSPTSLDRASAAFAWVCRQVRLAPSPDPLPAPPGFVLRRGSGSAVERAVVFLALLEQFGLLQNEKVSLQGCLLFVPGKKKQPELWACGVTPSDEPGAIYLFDPRLGLPVPGPKGDIATLKQARDDPRVLAQLKVDSLVYDVTADRAKLAEPAVYAPLSALSARMRHLQERLLRDREIDGRSMPPAVRVKLAEEEPGALDAIREAFAASGGDPKGVNYWREGVTVLRRFVPREEGGSDTGVPFAVASLKGFVAGDDPFVARLPRSRLLHLASVPWENFPLVFRNDARFGFDMGIGQGIRGVYAAPFVRWLIEPNSPREQIVRGRLAAALNPLVTEERQWLNARDRRLELEQLEKGIADWKDRAIRAYAAQIQAGGPGNNAAFDAEVNRLWRWKIGEPMDVLMSKSVADARGADVSYQLALCKHEQAVRQQIRLTLAEQAGVKTDDDIRKTREAWEQAASSWKQYLDAHGKRPAAASAHRWHGEAQMYLGDRESAAKSYNAAAVAVSDSERLAALWLAKGAEGK